MLYDNVFTSVKSRDTPSRSKYLLNSLILGSEKPECDLRRALSLHVLKIKWPTMRFAMSINSSTSCVLIEVCFCLMQVGLPFSSTSKEVYLPPNFKNPFADLCALCFYARLLKIKRSLAISGSIWCDLLPSSSSYTSS